MRYTRKKGKKDKEIFNNKRGGGVVKLYKVNRQIRG